jgi:hypothetical protein
MAVRASNAAIFSGKVEISTSKADGLQSIFANRTTATRPLMFAENRPQIGGAAWACHLRWVNLANGL